MDTAWIQVFILSISECVAPAGKTVCQEQQFELEFLTRSDCEVALEQFIALKDESERVIVDKDASSCFSTAQEARGLGEHRGCGHGARRYAGLACTRTPPRARRGGFHAGSPRAAALAEIPGVQ